MGRDVRELVTAARGQSLAVGQAMALLEDRGWALAVLLLTVPFVLPFPTLGMALPVGALLAVAALGLALGRRPWLPGPLARRHIAHRTLTALARAIEGIPGRVPKARPRLGVMTTGPLRSAIGSSLCCASLVLALPLPIPLSNFFPAVAILLLAAGLIEGDGLLVIAGHVVTAAVCVGLYTAADVVWSAVQGTLAWIL